MVEGYKLSHLETRSKWDYEYVNELIIGLRRYIDVSQIWCAGAPLPARPGRPTPVARLWHYNDCVFISAHRMHDVQYNANVKSRLNTHQSDATIIGFITSSRDGVTIESIPSIIQTFSTC